jgi:hypothetical protein
MILNEMLSRRRQRTSFNDFMIHFAHQQKPIRDTIISIIRWGLGVGFLSGYTFHFLVWHYNFWKMCSRVSIAGGSSVAGTGWKQKAV